MYSWIYESGIFERSILGIAIWVPSRYRCYLKAQDWMRSLRNIDSIGSQGRSPKIELWGLSILRYRR